jgi:hypothetical protein
MKKYVGLVLLVILAGCQKEEFEIVQDDDQEIAQDGQLLRMVQTVATHDGSFDDVVDDSSCFSIDFPYICNFNGKLYPVNRASDLLPFSTYDNLVPEFPVNVTLANYLQVEVPNLEAFENLIAQCQNGDLFNDRITCIDLEYPVSLALFDSDSGDFETLVFNHDRDTFTGIGAIEDGWVASLNYPLEVTLESGALITITSNEQLKSEILNIIPLCD